MLDAVPMLALARAFVLALTVEAIVRAFLALRGRRTKAALWWMLAAALLSGASVALLAWTRSIPPSPGDLREP